MLCQQRPQDGYLMDETQCQSYVIPLNSQALSIPNRVQLLQAEDLPKQNHYKNPQFIRNGYESVPQSNVHFTHSNAQKPSHYHPVVDNFEDYSDGFYSPASSINSVNNNYCASLCQSPVTNSMCSSVSPSPSFSPQSPCSTDSFEAFAYRPYEFERKNSTNIFGKIQPQDECFKEISPRRSALEEHPKESIPDEDMTNKYCNFICDQTIDNLSCANEKKVDNDQAPSRRVRPHRNSKTQINSLPAHQNNLESESAQVSDNSTEANKTNKTSPCSSSSSSSKKSKKRVGRSANPIVKKKRRLAANARERQRMNTLNGAFERLRSVLPSMSSNRQLSKYECLQMAQTYINALNELIIK
ncbi:unnamed protein product [Allacma fusca]|uniref:BHLH domain-containing protein n=1 Tax=Allacma fusca TaxID=39272 RepID=A0A8J2PFT1_9HEXA|nr:unnamed protein product [Allacma fusca]